MIKRVTKVLFLAIFVFSFAGCATIRKQKDLEIQGLRNQVSVLEARIQSKDEEIANLRDALRRAMEGKEALREKVGRKEMTGEVKSRPNARQIQIALKNAGYDPGRIDGRIGRQTRDAIKAFQRANNLVVDGKVGKKTWELLKDYLYKKIK